MKRLRILFASALLLAIAAPSSWALVPVPFTIVGEHFKKGDRIMIDEIQVSSWPLRKFSEVHIRGHYVLSSTPIASLTAGVTIWPPEKIRPPEPHDVDRPKGDFQIVCGMPRQGPVFVEFSPIFGGKKILDGAEIGRIQFVVGHP